jgi:hypothetical protein
VWIPARRVRYATSHAPTISGTPFAATNNASRRHTEPERSAATMNARSAGGGGPMEPAREDQERSDAHGGGDREANAPVHSGVRKHAAEPEGGGDPERDRSAEEAEQPNAAQLARHYWSRDQRERAADADEDPRDDQLAVHRADREQGMADRHHGRRRRDRRDDAESRGDGHSERRRDHDRGEVHGARQQPHPGERHVKVARKRIDDRTDVPRSPPDADPEQDRAESCRAREH